MALIITNAFSINMLLCDEGRVDISFRPISKADALADLSGGFISAVGHADTAALFSAELGVEVPMNRATISFDANTALLVGQYTGPRLPEGCHTLPEGASIQWWYVYKTPEPDQDWLEGRC